MTQIKSEIRINASKEKVWEVLRDFGGVSKWAPTVAKSFSTTTATEGVGCERKCEIPGFGNVSERITEWDEGTRIKYAVEGVGPMKSMTSGFSLRREGKETLATMTVNFQMKFGIIGALMDRLMVRRFGGYCMVVCRKYAKSRRERLKLHIRGVIRPSL